jgi:hypothetical protein
VVGAPVEPNVPQRTGWLVHACGKAVTWGLVGGIAYSLVMYVAQPAMRTVCAVVVPVGIFVGSAWLWGLGEWWVMERRHRKAASQAPGADR